MKPSLHGPAALAVCLLCLVAPIFTKPLSQNIDLNAFDRLHYFGQDAVQDFELVSPRITSNDQTGFQATFEAFGQAFTLSLKPAEGLFDAGTLVHEMGSDGKTVLAQPLESCLYQGESLEHQGSAVSASNCGNKLEASVKTKEASFQLMPLKAQHREDSGPTHMMLRKTVNDKACNMNAERPAASASKSERSDPIYVEASLVADDLMYKTYGNNTTNYLLTILNQVAGLLKDSSLDVEVNLKISNIKIMKSPQADLPLSEELDKSLESFCAWQKELKSDISILVTRRDLISAGSHQVTGKTADVGGACDPERRCLISQDHGPSGLIFTLAHEIGHSLGMYHDGGLSDCANRKNIMATVNSGGPEAFHWSECSNRDLNNFLAQPQSKCLKDKPKSLPSYTPASIPMPGFYYNASEQCAMTFNPRSTVASEVLNKKEICKALVCKTGKGAPESTNTPPLDGTRCGSKREICIQGECLKVYSTLDCDGGECIPFWLESSFKCNSDNCVESRSVLCVERHDDGTTRRVTDLTRCPPDEPISSRTCLSDPCRYFYVTESSSTCSVSCETGVQTRNVYCQDRVDSSKVDDILCTLEPRPAETQVCDTNVACPTMPTQNIYSYVTGEFSDCSATCGDAVQSRIVTCQNNNNGVFVVDFFCEQANLDKPVETQACSLSSCPLELRYIAGPLSDCSVTCGTGVRSRMIYCVNGANRVVANTQCEDVGLLPLNTEVPCNLEACAVPTFTAVRGQFGDCSVTCGVGVEERVVLCFDENSVSVDIQNCIDFGLDDLESQRICTLPACPPPFRFEAGAYGECSVSCGTGSRSRSVQCLDEQNQAVDALECIGLGLLPPTTIIACTLPDCVNYLYQFSSFGECSATCGDGLRIRTVVCVNNDTNEIVDDSNCPGLRPNSTQPCNLADCPVILEIVRGPFSACNCSGIQTRLVICISTSGSILNSVPLQECVDAGLGPLAASQECTPPPSCVQPEPVWQTTEWGSCSVTCGVGTQARLVYCIEGPGSTVIVPNSRCIAADEPPTTQECDTEVSCPTNYVWLAFDWQPCSVTCGSGFQSREVICFSLGLNIVQVNDSFCNAGEKPPTLQACNLDPCTASWTTSDWTECSVTCGVGLETRTIACRVTKDPASNLVDEAECIAEDRPVESRPCQLAICPSPFGCNTTSMLVPGVQYTESSPGFNEGQNYPNDLECDKGFAAAAPENTNLRNPRNTVPAPAYYIQLTFIAFDLEDSPDCTYDYLEIMDVRYNTTERLCGSSYDLPLVWSSQGPYIDMHFHTDASVTRPGYSVIYNTVERQEQARYVVSEWSECSVTCGEGVQMRNVACYRGNQTLDDGECSDLERPSSTQPCEEDECVQPDVCSGDAVRTEDGSNILSPGFPVVYPVNVTCYNEIRAPEGMVVKLSISYFNLSPSPDCEGDKVLIKDKNAEGEGLAICGPNGPAVIFTSITNEVVIQFISDSVPELDSGFGYSLIARFINEQGSPCGRDITTSGQAVYSPNYPEDYNNGENCVTVIRNDNGCIQLRFLDIDLPPYSASGECTDFVNLVDLNVVDINTGPICGSEIPSVFYSATGLLAVRFFSDFSGNSSGGYNAVARFVPCSAGLWVTGPYGECSATCGDAIRSRTVACQDPITKDELDPAMCPPEKPDETLSCDTDDCPSCDAYIVSGGFIFSPNSPNNYDNNQRCTTYISNEEGCVTISFNQFDVQPGTTEGVCDKDFVEIREEGRDNPVRYCGLDRTPTYQSLTGDVQLVFQSDEALAFPGYVGIVSFNPCPINAYVMGNWSECSVTCGTGMRTRDVMCMDLLNNVPADDSLCSGQRPPSEEACSTGVDCPSCDVFVNEPRVFATSPGFPDEYENNLNCVYTFISPDPTQCVRLTLLEAYLEGPDDNGYCTNDYLELDGGNGQPLLRYCPESARSITWFSRSNVTEMTFVTDEEDSDRGFNIFVLFVPCPQYGYVAGPFQTCTAGCGGGTMTRTVDCVDLTTNTPVAWNLCPNDAPPQTAPCNEDPCPVCYEEISSPRELFSSPGFLDQGTYSSFLDCTYNITNPDGCVVLTLLTFEVEPCLGCTCDYLSFYENGEEVERLCGSQDVIGWESQTSNVIAKFVTDDTLQRQGFNIHVGYIDCRDAYFFTGDFMECDVSCGGGVQTREVYCRSRSTGEQVDEGLCVGTKPSTTRACGEDPCPFCDEVIESSSFIISPNHPAAYPISINCNYTIVTQGTDCASVTILSLDLEEPVGEPPECKDFIELTDPAAPVLNRKYCGSSAQTIDWSARFPGETSIRFYSDEEGTAGGFRAYVAFNPCTFLGFDAGPWSTCSRLCGVGVQTRDVTCMNFATNQEVDETMCEDDKPADTRLCNTEACPVCDRVVTESRENIYSLNHPEPYFEYNCNYVYSNPGGCVELLFVEFEMPEANMAGICDKDYLLVEDQSARPFSYRICGDDAPNSIISRGPTLNVTLVTDGNPSTFGEGYQLYNLFATACPQAGYVAGEWEECDRQCGGGTRTRDVVCTDLISGLGIDDSLCQDLKPHDMELCNSDPCPSCDQLLDSFPVGLTSPNFPDSFDPQRTCRYNITSSSCIKITFLTFDLPPPEVNMVCGDTFVQLRDLGADYLSRRYCGAGPGSLTGNLFAWESRTGQVMVTLNSGLDIGEGRSFSFYITEIDCPEFGFVAGNFSECSATCGTGMQTRSVECQRLADGELAASEDLCTDPKPVASMPCPALPPCPSCDMFVDEVNMLIVAPPKDGTWTADINCRVTVELDTCIKIAALELRLSDPDENGTCVDSSLTLNDGMYPGYSQQLCGEPSNLPINFFSLTNRTIVDFYSAAYEASSDNYGLFVQANPCPDVEYEVSQFSVCSATCGGGTLTRDVNCVRQDTDEIVPDEACSGTPPPSILPCNTQPCPQECSNVFYSNNGVLTSPGLPTYKANSDCTNTIFKASDCMRITILSLDIEEGSQPGVCDRDYLEILDASNPELNVRLCGSTVPSTPWNSKSAIVRTRFVSDGVDTMQAGYRLEYTFDVDCPTGTYVLEDFGPCSTSCGGGNRTADTVKCEFSDMTAAELTDCPGLPPSPVEECNVDNCTEFYIYTGDFSSCSVSCGAGTQTRVVECRRIDTDAAVGADSCNETLPETVMNCMDAPCENTMFVVDSSRSSYTLALGDTGTLSSPNFPSNYPDNLNGMLTLNIPASSRLMIVINNLNLVFDTPCANGDSLRFSSGIGNELSVCSTALGIPFTWYSRQGDTEVAIEFITSPTNSASGFSGTWAVIA